MPQLVTIVPGEENWFIRLRCEREIYISLRVLLLFDLAEGHCKISLLHYTEFHIVK